jgi:hypothetical protein
MAALVTYLLVLLGTTLLLRHKTDWFVASPTAAAGFRGVVGFGGLHQHRL